MHFFKPKLPNYTYEEFKSKSFSERVKLASEFWGLNGFGAPVSAYLFYILKMSGFFFAWVYFSSFSNGLGGFSNIEEWFFKPEALYKAIIWAAFYESLGLGAGSGPLTARYIPPIGGFVYWLMPGTIKLPLFPGLPIIGNNKRSFLDVAVYALYIFLMIRVLIAPQLTPELIVPPIIVIVVLGILDKPIFLAARSEHYLTAMVAMLFIDETLAAFKWIWLGVWIWAATSKLNSHFGSVIGVMVSNSGVMRFPWLKKMMYKNYPNDMRASTLSKYMAHMGTVIEYSFPLVLVLSGNQEIVWIALIVMFFFHLFITINIPMAVPLEWNVIMVYGGFVLFGFHPEALMNSVHSPLLILILLTFLVFLPIFGNFFPKYVSFLLSMRYYAGNWAYTVWLFKGDLQNKLDENLRKPSKDPAKQISKIYGDETAQLVLGNMLAFRMMHIHGRALHDLIPLAVKNIDEYTWREGEMMCGTILGWNFGDGHLHGMQLLKSVQKYCNFKEDELVCIMVESQPLFYPYMKYKIVDAAAGIKNEGEVSVKVLETRQPWPSN